MLSRPTITIIATIISWISAGCTIHFFWCCFKRPQALPWNQKIDNEFEEKRRFSDATIYAYIVSVWLGVGYCIFGGAEATLQWMPRGWLSYSEDGDDPIWIGYGLAGAAAFFGSMWIVQAMEKVATTLIDVERDRGDQ